MRSLAFTGASALVLLAASAQGKHGVHQQLEAIHRRHRHEREVERQANETLVKRGSCAFPSDCGLVAVSPSSGNGGWAFAPDQTCYAGRYCPYACPPGQVSMQWDPTVTSYVYPGSMNGGLLCNSDGTLSKPYPNRPYCQSTNTNIGVTNTCGQNVAFCQTVLPGDEDMLIPTDVMTTATLAVPGPSYWASTAAHYYINPPGVSSAEGCVWGSTANPYGNWSPYVAGANVDASGMTFLKIGWNPIYLEPATPFKDQMPTWGVKIDCPNGGCSGLPCGIDPASNSVNEMMGSSSIGAGGGAFCVVTVAAGSTANFFVWQGRGTGNQGQWSNLQASQAQSYTSSATTSKTTSTPSAVAVAAASSLSSNLTVSLSTPSFSSEQQWMTADYSVSTSSAASGPTGQPNFELFNGSDSETRSTSGESTATSTTLVSKHTGGALALKVPVAAILFGIAATLL